MKNHLTCGSFEFQVPLGEGTLTFRIEKLEIQFETSPEVASRYLDLLQQTFEQIEQFVQTLQGVRT